jgi:RNA polymerase sigma-70 factor (ECF subfamily)
MKNENEHAGKGLQLKELEGRLAEAMNDLPEQCRTIFQLSRFEELRYREIADRLGLSIKTVENQMGKALKILRVKLVDFLPLTLLGLIEILKAII